MQVIVEKAERSDIPNIDKKKWVKFSSTDYCPDYQIDMVLARSFGSTCHLLFGFTMSTVATYAMKVC